MNRREFFRRAAIVAAGAIAADQLELLERLAPPRRYWWGADFGREVLRVPADAPPEYLEFLEAFRRHNELVTDLGGPPVIWGGFDVRWDPRARCLTTPALVTNLERNDIRLS